MVVWRYFPVLNLAPMASGGSSSTKNIRILNNFPVDSQLFSRQLFSCGLPIIKNYKEEAPKRVCIERPRRACNGLKDAWRNYLSRAIKNEGESVVFFSEYCKNVVVVVVVVIVVVVVVVIVVDCSCVRYGVY
jgi:hypothetical protein